MNKIPNRQAMALPDAPVITGTSSEVFHYHGLDAEGIAKTVEELV